MNKTPLNAKLETILKQLSSDELEALVHFHPDVINYKIITSEYIIDEITYA